MNSLQLKSILSIIHNLTDYEKEKILLEVFMDMNTYKDPLNTIIMNMSDDLGTFLEFSKICSHTVEYSFWENQYERDEDETETMFTFNVIYKREKGSHIEDISYLLGNNYIIAINNVGTLKKNRYLLTLFKSIGMIKSRSILLQGYPFSKYVYCFSYEDVVSIISEYIKNNRREPEKCSMTG